MGENKQLLINISTQIISFISTLAINFFLVSFIVEKVSREVYGFVGLANNFVSYITVFTVAINSMLNRYVLVKLEQNQQKNAYQYYSSVAIANILITCILILPSLLLINNLSEIIIIPDGFLRDVQLLFLMIFASFFLSLACSVFNIAPFVKNRLDLASKIDLWSNILRLLLILIAYGYFPPKLWYVGAVTLICNMYVVIAKKKYMRTLLPDFTISRKYYNFKSLIELFKVGLWNSINQLSSLLMTGLDLLITNLFLGPIEMSLLSISKTIPVQLQSFIQMVSNVFTPRLTKIYVSRDKDSFIYDIISSMKITGYIGSVPIIGLIAYGDYFFSLWIPSSTESDIYKIHILSVLSLLPLIINSIINPLFNVNTITTKVKLPVLSNVFIGIANIIVVYFILKYTEMGVYGVVITSGFLIMTRMLSFVPIYVARILNVHWFTFYKVIVRYLLSFTILLVLFIAVKNVIVIDTWPSFILLCLISGGIGYSLMLIIFTRSEVHFLFNYLKLKLLKR